MKRKLRVSRALLLLLGTAVVCLIAGVFWFRSNTIIRSAIPGTLVARTGERFPTNRWFHIREFNPMDFYADVVQVQPAGNDLSRTDGRRGYSVLETSHGKFRANIELWRYEGSAADDFQLELLVQLGERIN